MQILQKNQGFLEVLFINSQHIFGYLGAATRIQRGTASSVHAVRGLICTRGQGPRLYTRNGFAVCTSLFLQLCILCAPCVQVVLYRSLAVVLRVKRYSSWFCSTWYFVLFLFAFLCVQVQGTLSSHPPPPTHPPYPPTTRTLVCVQPQRYVCVYSWECMQVQGMLPSPPHPPPTPTQKYVCVCTVGNVCKSKVCYHAHPPTHPPQRYVCVCVYR